MRKMQLLNTQNSRVTRGIKILIIVGCFCKEKSHSWGHHLMIHHNFLVTQKKKMFERKCSFSQRETYIDKAVTDNDFFIDTSKNLKMPINAMHRFSASPLSVTSKNGTLLCGHQCYTLHKRVIPAKLIKSTLSQKF